MGDTTTISWADRTFNPWIGCTKISPACDGCYAEALMGEGGRFNRVVWGAPGKGDGTRDRTAPSNWAKPRKWNREAADAPGQTFVFCSSLADVFDNAVPPEWRRDLFDLIRETPHLTWLLLTKRPGMVVKLFADTLPATADKRNAALEAAWPRNAAIGCTIINQDEADRDVPKLLAAKAALKPAFAFLSMEPLLGPVQLWKANGAEGHDYLNGGWYENDDPAQYAGSGGGGGHASGYGPKIDWVITGGETDQGNHKARPADPAWFRSLRDQCAAAGVPFHFKQWGEWQPGAGVIGSDIETFGDRVVTRAGKDCDPCTLDGVEHFARPEVRIHA